MTDTFRSVRDSRVDKYVVETNKLLIRLDKLISPDAPTEAGKRKGSQSTIDFLSLSDTYFYCMYLYELVNSMVTFTFTNL